MLHGDIGKKFMGEDGRDSRVTQTWYVGINCGNSTEVLGVALHPTDHKTQSSKCPKVDHSGEGQFQ
jgi:hypothetical protein